MDENNAADQSEDKETSAENEDNSNYRKLLVFNVGDKKFSVDSELVEEIVNYTDIYPLPFVPDCVQGVINLRGKPVTVYNPFISGEEDFKGISNFTHCNILKFKTIDEDFGINISSVDSFITENKIGNIEELDVNKMKTDLRNALGYEND